MAAVRGSRWTGRAIPVAAALAAACTPAGAAVVVDFEQHPPGTVLVAEYADAGGPGQGVVFGPLPGGGPGEGLKPVVRAPGEGLPTSGTNVADFGTCVGCEFFTPRTTATFATPRSRVSMSVGYLGAPAFCHRLLPNAIGCAEVTVRAVDADGAVVAQATARVVRGGGVRTPLAVATPAATIVGVEITGRPAIDDSKPLAIDDLTLETPPGPPTPDITLNPSVTDLIVPQGGSRAVAVTIGRLGGSAGDVDLTAEGLPDGVTAAFTPDPAGGGQTTLTLTASPTAAPGPATVTVTGTPSPSAGPAPRAFRLALTVQRACPQAQTAAQLVDALAAGHRCVFVTRDIDLATELDGVAVPPHLTDEEAALVIPDGVTLMGSRSFTERGAALRMSRRTGKTIMLRLGSDTRVTGLRLEGYQPRDRRDRDDPTRGIAVFGASGVVIDNNELSGWPNAGVDLRDSPPPGGRAARITGNYMHHNVQCNLGYGVVVYGPTFARIDRNVFDHNRHDVAGGGEPGQGYLAELNLSLTSGPRCNPGDTFQHYNQHYDMHGNDPDGYGGVAGRFIEVSRNTIRGAQQYFRVNRRPAFLLRGTPEERLVFRDNVLHSPDHMGRTGAVRVRGASEARLIQRGKLVVRGNRLCVDTASELAVGDFDGDTRADVFQSAGTVWVVSPQGRREWHVVNDSTVRLGRLGFGDFDGDGRTDVLVQSGARWMVSHGARGRPRPLPFGSDIPARDYRYGDFDGDRRTDVFRADGRRFFISSGAATGWRPLVASRFRVGGLRFGDFNGDRITDVFSLANGRWSVSDGGTMPWRRLNRRLSSDLDELAFGDFDGDGRTDIARQAGGNWWVSHGGATPWRVLQFRRGESLSARRGMLVADFTGDGRADILQHGERRTTPLVACWAVLNGTARFQSFSRWPISRSGSRKPERWTVFGDMR